MLNLSGVKKGAAITLFFFIFFTFSQSFSFAENEETLEKKLQRYFFDGDLEGAIKMLEDYIDKIKNIEEKKTELAGAYYHLAKTCFKAGLKESVTINLTKTFEIDPNYTREEFDPGFRDLVAKTKKEVTKSKEEQKGSVAKDTQSVQSETEKTEKLKTDLKAEDKVTSKKEKSKTKPEKKIIEKTGDKPKKKKKKFPILLVLGGIVVVVGIILLMSKKDTSNNDQNNISPPPPPPPPPPPTVYDIRGKWNFFFDGVSAGKIHYWGELDSGKCHMKIWSYEGKYTVDGENVEWDDGWPLNSRWVYKGKFIDQKTMEGEYFADGNNQYLGKWKAEFYAANPAAEAGENKRIYKWIKGKNGVKKVKL